jgi:transcriptional regulator
MYVPTVFEETDQGKLHDFIESYNFALLVSAPGDVPVATHLPMLLERDTGPHGCLVGHMARANPQWQGLADQQVLVVFSGPHVYVSPSWYEADNVVPTWNYVAVHAYGTFRLVEDTDELTRTLTSSVATFERSRPKPWVLDTSTAYFQKLLAGVVGFRVEISRLEGKWKLNQNHPEERRHKVLRALAEQDSPEAQEVARLLAEMLRAPDAVSIDTKRTV